MMMCVPVLEGDGYLNKLLSPRDDNTFEVRLGTINPSSTPQMPADSSGAIQRPLWAGFPLDAWMKVFIVTVLLAWLFYVPSLRRLWQKTNPFWGEPNWGHAVVVPIVGLYFLYLHREELRRARVRPLLGGRLTGARLIWGGVLLAGGAAGYFASPHVAPAALVEYAQGANMALAALGALGLLLDWGLGSLVFGLLVAGYGIWPGQNDWLKDFGMVMTIFGVVLTLCGWAVMKIAWFPIAFLICGIPWPALVYSKIAGPLQQLAASVAVWTLQLTGVDSSRSGTKIFIGDSLSGPVRILNVAEACAGLRSLMTFISVGAAVAFLSNRPLWQKILLTLSAVPIAIFCNVMRVAGQGLLDYYISPELSQSFAHQFVGLVMLVPAFFLILLVGWLLDQVFVEEVEHPEPSRVKVTSRPVSSPGRGLSVEAMEGQR